VQAKQIAVVAGLIGGVGWIAKLVIMAIQGGPDLDSVPETIAFALGLVGVVVVGAAALGVHLARGRPTGVRVLAAVGGVLTAVLVTGLGQTALTALPGNSWVQEEAIFGVVGAVALALAGWLRTSDR
jgi:hypothetical protein